MRAPKPWLLLLVTLLSTSSAGCDDDTPTCRSNDDCGDDQVCVGEKTCDGDFTLGCKSEAGRCTPLPTEGEPCLSGFELYICAKGLACHPFDEPALMCGAPKPLGGACWSDFECHAQVVPGDDAPVCLDKKCAPAHSLNEGDACGDDRECAVGLTCFAGVDGGTCTAAVP